MILSQFEELEKLKEDNELLSCKLSRLMEAVGDYLEQDGSNALDALFLLEQTYRNLLITENS